MSSIMRFFALFWVLVFFRVEIYDPVPPDLCRTIQEKLAHAGDPAANSHRSGGLDHTVPTRCFP